MANYLGIEIGHDVVRGVLIKTALRKVQVARLVEVPIPSRAEALTDAVQIGPAGTLPTVGEPSEPMQIALRNLLRQVSPPMPTILAALPGEDASIRRMELPAIVAKKVDELLPLEMEALVPFDAATTMLDHQPIETADGKLRVLVAAVPNERIRAHLEQLAKWGADPQELAVGAAALDGLPAVVPALATDGPHLVLHLGHRRTDVCILRKGRAELARTISAGYADLDGASFPTPGAPSQTGPFGGAPAAGASAERLARELKQTIASFRMQGGEAPASVHVSGAGLEDPRTLAWLRDTLGQEPVAVAVPDTSPPTGMTAEHRARFGLALSLAARALGRTRRIDLRKGEFAPRRTSGLVRRHAPLLATCAASIVAAFLFSTYARWSVLEARREMLEDQLAQVTESRLGEGTRSPSRARTLLEGGGGRSDPLPRFSAYDALGAVSGAIPADIPHDVQRLQIDLGDDRSGGHFELSGIVGSIEERDRIAQALGQVECFRGIDLGPLTQAPNDRRSYRIEADILCPGDAPPPGATKRRGGRSRSGGEGGR
jgi:general secretion pathway protein L